MRARSAVDALFAYGTLQLPEILEALCGPPPLAAEGPREPGAQARAGDPGRWRSRPARLPGHRCRRMRSARYPGIRPAPGETTLGSVYSGLEPEHWRVLDAFEGDLYERLTLPVELAESEDGATRRSSAAPLDEAGSEPGEPYLAQVYVVREPYWEQLADSPWELELFATAHLDAYVRSCRELRLELLGH